MKLLKYTSRRRSFKSKSRKAVLPIQTMGSGRRTHISNSRGNPQEGVPTAFIRNGISGEGPGTNGLYQINDRIYTTTNMFLRDGYMYPRQPGQAMDPRFPYELHEFNEETGAAGLQLVAAPKVHISGEYIANDSAGRNLDAICGDSRNLLNGRYNKKSGSDIYRLKNQKLLTHHNNYDESNNNINNSYLPMIITSPCYINKSHVCSIHNVDNFVHLVGEQTVSATQIGRNASHSANMHRRKKKVSLTTID